MSLIKRHKQGWAIALTLVGFLALGFVPSLSALPFLVDQGVQRLLLFALVGVFVALLGGGRALAPSAVGLRRSLRAGAYPVLVALVLCVVEMVSLLQLAASGQAVGFSPTWAIDLAGAALLCLGVGLYEEALFRVLLLGGLLSRHGGTRNGVIVSALVSSLAFGAAHVGASASLDPVTLAQMLLKTAQTALIGVLFAAAYVRTHSFLGVVAAHALSDFLLMAPLALLGGIEGSVGSYVSGGEGIDALVVGLGLVAVYLVVVALYVPAAAYAWRILEVVPVPERGPLEAGWSPRGDEALAPDEDARPVRPTGL